MLKYNLDSGGLKLVFETLTGQLTVVITLGFGALLIALFPLLNKENRYFAWFSMIMGIIVWLLLLWFTFGNEVIRNQILRFC
jgi:Na+/proline symporter